MELLVILFIVTILLNVFEAKIKGYIGEWQVNRALQKVDGYKILNDIMLKTDRGTTQIDHILIGRKGIFVIETKNYNGWIFGDDVTEYWTQTIYKKKSKFYNPVWQNRGHLKATQNCLDEKYKVALHSIVVFTNKSDLVRVSSNTPVIQLKKLRRYIENYEPEYMLGSEDIMCIHRILAYENITDRCRRKEHIRRVKNI